MIGRSLLSVAPRVVTVIRRPSVSTLSTRQLLVIGGSGALVAAASAATAATSACDGTREIGEAPRLRILCLHGINLNMFGKRDPGMYGTATLCDIDDSLAARANALGVEVECFQTNFEGEMVERIHKAHVDGARTARRPAPTHAILTILTPCFFLPVAILIDSWSRYSHFLPSTLLTCYV